MTKRKNKVDKKMLVGLGITLAFLLVIGLTSSVKAEWNFWQYVGDKTAESIGRKAMENSPDFSVSEMLGAISGPEVYQDMLFYESVTVGGGNNATSSSGTATTLGYKDLNNYHVIDLMSNVGSFTYTMPATSTMIQLLPEVGMSREWIFHNATSTASITLTMAAGAGMDLVSVTANDDIIDPGEWTRVTCTQIYYRTADNENIMCIVDELGDSD